MWSAQAGWSTSGEQGVAPPAAHTHLGLMACGGAESEAGVVDEDVNLLEPLWQLFVDLCDRGAVGHVQRDVAHLDLQATRQRSPQGCAVEHAGAGQGRCGAEGFGSRTHEQAGPGCADPDVQQRGQSCLAA